MHRSPAEPVVVRDSEPPSPMVTRPVTGASRGGQLLAWLVFLVVLGVGGYFGYQAWERERNKPPAAPPPARATPVIGVAAVNGDLRLYLEQLGTVVPLNTVTVRSRVGGELVKVAFEEGQLVEAGDLLVEIDPRPYQLAMEQAQAQVERDKALLVNTRADLERYRGAPDTVTKQVIDRQAALVAQTEATLATNQAQVNNAALLLSFCRITAPITGRIGLRRVDVGNIVQANTLNESAALAVITQVEPISVVFTVPENQISRVVKAMAAGQKLVVDAYDENDRVKLATGHVIAIDNQVDQTTGTVRVRAQFDNADGALFPNQFVRAHLLVETVRDAVIIPTAARQFGPPPNQTFVYVVNGETVELRNIRMGATEGDRLAVVEGLKEGEVVVTDGVDKLVPGGKVTVWVEGEGATTRPTVGGRRRAAPATRPAAEGTPDIEHRTSDINVGGGAAS